jgi:hypothetical protein
MLFLAIQGGLGVDMNVPTDSPGPSLLAEAESYPIRYLAGLELTSLKMTS